MSDFTAREPITLHIRLTHACNAACSYCSSWKRDPTERMTAVELELCLDGLEAFWRLVGISPTYLNVEYVGGEIMLIPPSELEALVMVVRRRFSSRMQVRDGAQSNLIGSAQRIEQLHRLFEGRVGTSVDHFTDQRQLGIKGSASEKAKRYRTFFMGSSQQAKSLTGHASPAVITLDSKNIDKVCQEIDIAQQDVRDLTFRPVFQGGCSIDGITDVELGHAMTTGFNHWMAKGMPIRIEPFATLFRKRLGVNTAAFCAWQRDCAVKSISIEPNGDFYVCQELADTNTFRLGNLINKDFDVNLHAQLAKRVDMLDKGCFECPYFSACQGGCMQQSVEVGTGMYGKTQWCHSWKMLFSAMDMHIEKSGKERLIARLNALHPEF
jgi:radical SAM protein with 4Fe4S-binding SPASM domain